MSKLQELDNKYVANTYARFPVEIVSGKGSIAKDTDGKEYIDMGSGIGVTSFGIADDIWKQAVIDQLGNQPVLHGALRETGGAALRENGHEESVLQQFRWGSQRMRH